MTSTSSDNENMEVPVTSDAEDEIGLLRNCTLRFSFMIASTNSNPMASLLNILRIIDSCSFKYFTILLIKLYKLHYHPVQQY